MNLSPQDIAIMSILLGMFLSFLGVLILFLSFMFREKPEIKNSPSAWDAPASKEVEPFDLNKTREEKNGRN